MSNTVDAVITWVDGNDPKHIEKKKKYLINADKDTHPAGVLEGRFLQENEIKYCIYSIRKFAPWVRNIFLVTDDQCPDWLTEELKKELDVTLVDHKIIFRGHLLYLPTFNTRSINTLLWKIPGLADRFLVFDDDNFLINEVFSHDFFIGDKTVLRGEWKPSTISWSKKIKAIIKHLMKKRRLRDFPWRISSHYITGAQLVGYKEKHFEMVHSPFPNRISILEEYYRNNPHILELNAMHRFRHKNQTTSSVLYSHLVLKHNKAIIKDGSDTMMIIPKKEGLMNDRSKFEILKDNPNVIKFLCFQDMYYLKQQNSQDYAEVIEYLDDTILSL